MTQLCQPASEDAQEAERDTARWKPGDDADLVLLDLDGTLCDSAEAITAAMAFSLDHHGLDEQSPETLRSFVGPPFAVALGGIGLAPEQIDPVVATYREHYRDRFMLTSPTFPGVPEALRALADSGLTLAVATSKPQATARVVVEHLGLERFLTDGIDGVFGADVTHPGDSKADVIGRALAQLDVSPGKRVVMVGDRIHDVEGAAAHGIPTIGAGWGYAPAGELEKAGAVVIVPTPEALVELLVREPRRVAPDGEAPASPLH